MLLRVYLILSILIGPLWRFAILRRVKRGKEDPKRVQEKFGTATLARPEGPLIWFHALSVGESLALLTLFETLAEQEPEAHFLLTTTTRSSVEALEKITLPPRVMHQYLPADTRRATQKFLAYWRPDKVVFSEFDLWPRMLFEVKKREIPAILMNVRLGAARAKKRKKIQSLMVFCFSVFDKILAQDAVSVPHIMEFDVPREKLSVVGSIKGSRAPLPDQAADRENIEKMVGDRPRWFSAASHPDEDPMLIAAHAEILKSDPRMLLIMAPRYMDRLYGLLQAVEDHGLIMARRSLGEDITPETQIYLADSFGEMGLWYRLSPVSALGHSMVEGPELQGKNPFEAAVLGSLILHGPHVAAFDDIYADFDARGAAILLNDPVQLPQLVLQFQDPDARAPFVKNARDLQKESAQSLTLTLDAIRAL